MVRAEFDRALEDVETYPREDVEVIVEGTDSVVLIGPGGEEFRGWKAEATFRRGTRAQTSFLYVFEKEGSFTKYRITHERSLRDFLSERAEIFVTETLASVVPEAE